MKTTLKYVCRDRDRHGNLRVYFRYPGQKKKRRFRSLEGTPQFFREYAQFQADMLSHNDVPALSNDRSSMRWIVNRYYRSARFQHLARKTKLVRERRLDEFLNQHGAKPYRRLKPRNVREIIDSMADRPGAANELLKILRQVLQTAVDDELIPSNPAARVRYLPTNPQGFRAWSKHDIDQFRAYYVEGSKPRLAFELLYGTGLRRSDIVEIGPQHVRDGILRKNLTKGKDRYPRKVSIPLSPYLQKLIETTSSGNMAFLVTENGSTYSAEGFSNTFVKWVRQAGLGKGLSPHGVRKASAVALAQEQATNKELQAVMGWSSSKQPDHYTKSADEERIAIGTAEKLARLAPHGWDKK